MICLICRLASRSAVCENCQGCSVEEIVIRAGALDVLTAPVVEDIDLQLTINKLSCQQ